MIIKKILSILNEKESFDHILIHHKIQLGIEHATKKLEDIAFIIDKEIKNKYTQIDAMIQNKNNNENIKIDENIQKACRLLIQNWFKVYKEKINLFEFTKAHLVDISVKILFDDKTKNILLELLINNPEDFIKIINSQNQNNESNVLISSSSLNTTIDNPPNKTFNDNYNYNYHNNNNYSYKKSKKKKKKNSYYNYNFQYNVNTNTIGVKNYCLAQAHVYEKLLSSGNFRVVTWKNNISENEEGELIILPNSHRYKIKNSVSDYDFTVITNHNKQYKISVKRGADSKKAYLKFSFTSSQWDLLPNEYNSLVFAFVSLKSELNPDIYFVKNIKLNDLY